MICVNIKYRHIYLKSFQGLNNVIFEMQMSLLLEECLEFGLLSLEFHSRCVLPDVPKCHFQDTHT